MPDMLSLSVDLPQITLDTGESLLQEGTRTGSIWILVSGSLRVTKNGVVINTISRAGAVFGEIAVLLGSGHSASVEAVEPSVLRYAQDGEKFFRDNVDALVFVANGLAERLDIVTGYLADLKNQYAAAPGISMVSDVLGRLVGEPGSTITLGSARDPDPEY
ncbi:MAG: Crp/Fnr family transcriptional regulator [Acidimicrobiia bacterium]